MRYLIPFALLAVLISTAGLAGENFANIGSPSSLRLRIVAQGFQLDWTSSPDDPGKVTGYEIVRADRFSGPYDPVATIRRGMTQYIDTTAAHEVIFFYKVRAVAGGNYSDFTNTVTGER